MFHQFRNEHLFNMADLQSKQTDIYCCFSAMNIFPMDSNISHQSGISLLNRYNVMQNKFKPDQKHEHLLRFIIEIEFNGIYLL